MGYNTLNGASATAISALMKYGLLEGRGDEIKISNRAMQILHPESPEEKAQAIRAAAAEPALFQEIAEKFPGRAPSDEILRNYLVRGGFAPVAVPAAILAYRETNEFVERESGAYDSPPATQPMEAKPVTHQAPAIPDPSRNLQQKIVVLQGDERALVQYQFEGGGSLRIVVGGGIDTEEALSMAETLIGLKRKELARRNAVKSIGEIPAEKDEE